MLTHALKHMQTQPSLVHPHINQKTFKHTQRKLTFDRHCQKDGKTCVEPHAQLKIGMEKAKAEMEHNGQECEAASMVEAELDLEIRGSQAVEGRRDSSACQSNGCCMDEVFLQHFLMSGANLARQQFLLLHNVFGKTYGMQRPLITSRIEEERWRRLDGKRKW